MQHNQNKNLNISETHYSVPDNSMMYGNHPSNKTHDEMHFQDDMFKNQKNLQISTGNKV